MTKKYIDAIQNKHHNDKRKEEETITSIEKFT